MPALLENTIPHIPAWRKLGLKLKYAKDLYNVENISLGEAVQQQRKEVTKRKREDTGKHSVQDESLDSSIRTLKKQKKSRERLIREPNVATGDTLSASVSVQAALPLVSKKDSAANVPGKGISSENKKHKKTGKLQPVKTATPSQNLVSGSPPTVASTVQTTPNRKRKSVSFTPETKTSDGDSIKQLYKTWVATQHASDPTFRPEAVGEALRSVQPPQLNLDDANSSTSEPGVSLKAALQKTPTKAIVKAKTKVKSTPPSEGHAHVHPALTYLTNHYTSPTTWKFSKQREVYLLKNLFSLSKIPSSYDRALQNYLSGLKSTCARKRTREEALAIVKADEEAGFSVPKDKEASSGGMESLKRRQESYDEEVRHLKRQLRTHEKLREREEEESDLALRARYAKRKRADIVLWSISVDEDTTHPPQSSNSNPSLSGATSMASAAPLIDETPGKVLKLSAKRKRKLRTGVPDDDDVSVSSTSSSSSSEGEKKVDNVEDVESTAKLLSGSKEGDEISSEESEGNSEESSEESNEDEESSASGSETAEDGSSDSGSGSGSEHTE